MICTLTLRSNWHHMRPEINSCPNLRPDGRGVGIDTPVVFLSCQKRRRGAQQFLAHLFRYFLPHMWKFHTQVAHGQVTRSRQVTSPQKGLDARHSCTDWTFVLKLSAIDTSDSRYLSIKCMSRNFDIGDLKSRQCCDHYKSTGKQWNAPLFEGHHSKHPETSGKQVSLTPWIGAL